MDYPKVIIVQDSNEFISDVCDTCDAEILDTDKCIVLHLEEPDQPLGLQGWVLCVKCFNAIVAAGTQEN